jgi:threonine/homoserine/homoserine lactone efflux protein
MPTSSTLMVFIVASYALAIVPGPAVVYIVNRSVAQGRKAGVYSALGIAAGGTVHVLAAALGVSAVLASSAVAFGLVKWAGAAYLIFLGFRSLRSADLVLDNPIPPVGNRRAFGQGMIVNILNPKTALFFLSYFPQFVHPENGPVVNQMVVLGVVFLLAALSSDLVYALAAGSLSRLLRSRREARQAQRVVTATVFFGLGAAAAFTE